MNWYVGVWQKYATFTGRARRKEYWMFYLFNMLVFLVMSAVDNALGLANETSGQGPFYGVYALAVLIPTVAVAIRRMHDTDHSGWYLLIPIYNFVLAVSDGTPGLNRFGPDPKASERGYAPAFVPAPVPLGNTPAVPAGWHPDPTGRHHSRYWDSAQWTASVADNGVTSLDPM